MAEHRAGAVAAAQGLYIVQHPPDPPSWPHIHDLEVREDYPAAVDALPGRAMILD